MAEAEPPDKYVCFYLPLVVKFQEKDEFNQLSKEQYSILYKYFEQETRLLKRAVPHVNDIVLVDSSIKLVFKVPRNVEAFHKFYDYAKRRKDMHENDLERAVRYFIQDMSLELTLGLKLYTVLEVYIFMDDDEFQKKISEVDKGETSKSRDIHMAKSELGQSHQKDKEFCILLPLKMKYENTEFTKEMCIDFHQRLKNDIAVLQKHIFMSEKLGSVRVVDVQITESGNIAVEFKIKKDETHLCQFYECAKDVQGQGENDMEKAMRSYLDMAVGSELCSKTQLSLFMLKREFFMKQIELVDIDESVDKRTQIQGVDKGQQKHTSIVKSTVDLFEHGSKDHPSGSQDNQQNRLTNSPQLMGPCIRKTLVVYVPTESGEIISSMKIKSKCKVLEGRTMLPWGTYSNMYHTQVTLPIRDLSSVEYTYSVKISKYLFGLFARSTEKKSITLRLNDVPLQRDMFSGLSTFDSNSYAEHVLDICFSPGQDSDSLIRCVKEIEQLFKVFKWPFSDSKELINILLERIVKNKTNKALLIFIVSIGNLFNNADLLKRIELLNSELAGIILQALKPYRLRDLNTACDKTIVFICYTLCEIRFKKAFCLMLFMDECYPFLDEKNINELLDKHLSNRTVVDMVNEGYDMEEPAKRVCCTMYTLCYNDNTDSNSKKLLRRILLRLPIRMTLCVSHELNLLKSPNACSVENELQMYISEVVSNSVKREIMNCTKNRYVEELYELWQCVRDTYSHESEMRTMFEKAIIDFVSSSSIRTEALKKLLLKFTSDKILFSNEESQCEILEHLSGSLTVLMHKTFLQLVRTEKFVAVCSIRKKSIFQIWLKRAIEIHMTEGSVYEVPRMYSALADLLSVKQIEREVDLKEYLQGEIFKRLEKSKLEYALKEMSKLESIVKDNPAIEEIFNAHISTLMRKKHIGKKAFELLQSVCTRGQLRVNSRLTARVVVMILDGSFGEDTPTDDFILFKEMTLDSKFWKSIFEGDGSSIGSIKDNGSYKKALSCLQSMQKKFINSDVPYTFLTEFQDELKFNALELLHILNTRSVDYRRVWMDISKAFEHQIDKIQVIDRVFRCHLNNIQEPSLPKRFCRLYQEIKSYENAIMKSSLSASDLQRDSMAQTAIKRLSSTCSKLDGVVKSTVFWNVGKDKIEKTFGHYLSGSDVEKKESEDEILPSIAKLFLDTEINREENEDDNIYLSHTDVDQIIRFFEIVLNTGGELYKFEWNRLCNDSEFLLKDCSNMFKAASYKVEIDIAEKYLHITVADGIGLTLGRLQTLPDMKNTVRTLKDSLSSLEIDPSDDKEFYDAVKSFEDLLSGDSSSYTFSGVSEALRTVYEITDPLSEDTIAVLHTIGKSSKLIEFLQSIIDDDIRNLIDAVEDISEQHVQETTVSSLIETKRFLQPLLKSGFEKRAQVVFSIIHKQTSVHGKGASSIPIKIDDCMNNLHNLKSLYNNVANRSEQTKETIENIVTIGKFEFMLDKDKNECPFKAKYSFKKNKTSHPRPVLFDLRSRALLLMNKRETSDGLKRNELEIFIGCIDRCSEISELVMRLHATGHIQYKTYKLVNNINSASLNTLKDSLQLEYDRWVDHLETIRMSYYLVNFLQGSQIFILHNYLATNLSDDNIGNSQQEVETLLKFIHPELSATYLKEVYEVEETVNGCFDEYSFIDCIGRILHRCCDSLALFERRLKDAEGQSKRITDVVQAGKLFVAHLDDSSSLVIKTILTLFYNTVKRLPEPNQILFCSRQTTWSEIDLLIRRCLSSFEYYGEKVLFCIANVEALPNELQFKLVGALRNLDRDARYLFAVVCRGSKNHPFVDELSEYVCKVRPLSDKVIEHIFHNECPDVTAITSTVAGLGKTTHIHQRSLLSGLSLKTLHVSGNFGKDQVVCQLKSLNIDESNMLHVDVGALGNSVEFDIFLFELIVLRFVTTVENSIFLSTSYVAIEIANSLQDSLRTSLQTAVSFKRLHLEWHNFEDFIVSKELHSPIQVVSHFLNKLDRGELDTTDVQFKGANCVTALSPQTCRKLLRKHFPLTANMSFCLVNIFLNVLSDQLKKMSSSSFFRTSRIKDMVGNKCKPTIRSSLVKALVEVSKEFSSRSVDTYRATQLSTLESSLNLDDSSKERSVGASAAERIKGMIQWEDSNHLMYVFHNQNVQTISPVYRDKNKVPDYIKSLFESQMNKELQDYKKMSQPELQVILQKVSRSNPLMLKDSTLQDLAKDYALTPDNLLKMILIMLRVKANIPVLIMGETGCGKTSLIRYLASICEVDFGVLNIHAGVEKQSIVDKIVSCNLKAMNHLDKEHWLFFDEINTSEYVGLISDMICHKTFSGHRLAPNLVLMGACNPYKLRSASTVSTAGLKGKILTDELSRLVYRVLPLPEMLVDYVWDFGSLDRQDEKLYIGRMIESVFYDKRKYHALFTDLLSRSQTFIRGKEETTCSVSLRDVKRCKTLAFWFMDILEKKKTRTTRTRQYIRMNTYETAIVLSLAHCYHSRISDVEGRKAYRQAIAEVFKNHGNTFTEEEIDSVIKSEQNDILNRMELPPGTAKNTALRENVFVLLVCILNRIPIFVVGKPGCSKSLSMQVIRSNLRGKDSKDEFFKRLPQLYCVSFQGSESSTSDGIIKVFEKAEKYQESNQLDDVMSVVILDEIGLAEISRFNPLKVLHNLLEPDGRDRPNVAVVGISNWSLDASKMNRAIHLSRPDMDENELLETGLSIFDSFVVAENHKLTDVLFTLSSIKTGTELKTEHFKDDLESIAKSYFKYSKIQTFPNFHGLRDFYSLVKFFAKTMSNASSVSVEEKRLAILTGLERNFGGLPSAERLTLLSVFDFNEKKQPCPVIELIRNNVEDEMARHLMLITTGESILDVLDRMLDSNGRENKELIFGSQFEEDLTDDYNYRILNRIIICMEQGVVLILKDLESIYGSLYDMLNQNYTIIGKKKNCRVALGPYSNPICHVATTFRCIVIVDDSKLKYSDPPFLNRFEKQHLRFSDIISPRQNTLINKMEMWVRSLCVLDYFDETDAFPIYGDDMISSLILKHCRDADTISRHEEACTLEKCKHALLWIIRPEVIMRIRNSPYEDMQYESEQLVGAYFDLPVHGGIEGLLYFQLSEDKIAHLTDPNLMTVIFTNSNIHTKVLQSINRWSFQVEKLGSFKSEKQLSLRMLAFWLESTTDILILQCSAVDDEKHIMLAKSVIERYRQEYLSINRNGQAKHVYFVMHMDRSKGRSNILSQINFLSSWELVTLDSLERPTTLLPKVCKMSLHDALKDKRPFNDFIKEQLFWAFTRIKYSEAGRSIDSITDLMFQIQSSEEMLEILDELVYSWLKMYFPDIDDMEWQTRVACDNQALQTSSSFIEALENYISQIICVPLAKYIYKMENECILDTFFVDDVSSKERKGILTKILFDNRKFSIENIPEESGPESYVCNAFDIKLKMPFSKVIFDNIETTRDEFLYSVKMLKGRCGIEPEDDLPEEILIELEKKQDLIICHQIPLVLLLTYPSALNDYVEDFCNIVSFTLCPRLPATQRVEFTKWILSDYLTLHGKDFSEGIVSTHIVFWNHSTLFMSQLKLLETCKDLLTTSDLVELNILETSPLSVHTPKASSESSIGSEIHGTQIDPNQDNTDRDEHVDSIQQSTAHVLDTTKGEGKELLSFTLDTEKPHSSSIPKPEKKMKCLEISTDSEKSFDLITSERECSISQIEFGGAQIKTETEQDSDLNTLDNEVASPSIGNALEHDSPKSVLELYTEVSEMKPCLSVTPTLDINELKFHLSVDTITDRDMLSHDGEVAFRKSDSELDINDFHQSNFTSQDTTMERNTPYATGVIETQPYIKVEEPDNLYGMKVDTSEPDFDQSAVNSVDEQCIITHNIATTEENETTDVSYKSKIEPITLEKSLFEKNNGSFDSYSLRSQTSETEITMPTRGKELLVQIVCRKMLPTKITLQHFANIKAWHIHVNSVLSLVSKVDPDSQCIHYLRICSDIVSGLVLPNNLDISLIDHLASCLQADDTLDSADVFHALFDIIKQPLPGSENVRQRILSDYFLRCLISDPESQALSYLMNLISDSDLPHNNVSVFKLVIKVALDFEKEEEEDIYFRILESGLSHSGAACSGEDDNVSDTDSDHGSICERAFFKDLDTLTKRLDGKGMHDCPIVILIIDIFEDIFADHMSYTDDSYTMNPGHILEMLVQSQKLITQGRFNLQFVIACGYFKACVKYLVQNIDPTNAKQNEYINALLACESDSNVNEYVWKMLAQEKIASKLRTHLDELKEILPNVGKIPYADDYINHSIDRSPVLVFVKSRIEHTFEDIDIFVEGSLNKTFENVVSDAPTSKDHLLFLIGYAERMFYIPRSYSLLDDKKRSLASSVFKLVNESSLNANSNHLLQCLLGKEDFRIANLLHSEQSPPLDCLLNAFLVSVYALSITHLDNLESMPFFQKCLHQPTDIMKCFIPGNPDVWDLIQPVRSHEPCEVWFAICSCHHRLAVVDSYSERMRCPICNKFIKKLCIKKYTDEDIEYTTGFSMDDSFKKPTHSVRRLSPISCQIISLIIKGCLLGFLALGKGQPEQLEELLSVSAIDISSKLWNEVEDHWNNIGKLLGLGEYSVGLYLHTVLKHSQDALFITCPEMKTTTDRLRWENDFETIIQNVTKDRFSRCQEMIEHHHKICGVKRVEFEDKMLEINTNDANPLATCFRMKSGPSFENFICELFPVKGKYPILNLILNREYDVQLSRHIQSIMQWHIAVVSTANYTIRKHECLALTVSEFIQQVGEMDKPDVLRKRFGELQRSWSKLNDLLKKCSFSGEITRIHANLKMESCIIHDSDCIQYKVLEFLVETHNTFLDDVLSVANCCESVQFLMRSENIAVFPCIGISDIASVHLLGSTDLPLNWQELLEDKAHCDTTYGQGKMIWYDFFSIESLLADRILAGRAFILLNSLPNIVFTDELYKNYVSLSQDIKTKVEQTPLSLDMKAKLIEKQKSDTRVTKELLMQIGMIMTLINKTGGEPDKCLIDYVEEIKNTLTKRFSDELLPTPSSAVKLCHVVSLYELLEELNADLIIEALEDTFRRELGMDLDNHFDNLVKTNTRLATFTLSACKRFISRCLSLREADETRPLLDYLSDDSFWPEGVKVGDIIRYGDSTEQVEKIIPNDVMVNHIYCLVSLISTEIENQRMERMEMSKMATSWHSSQKSKPVLKEKRKMNVAVKKRRNIRL